jgi:uncharacterized protein (TIGR02118 family)
MIKLMFVVRRRPDVSPEEFHRYWRDEHGPLFRSFQGVLGYERYVQVHRLDVGLNDSLRESRGTSEPYDGVAEVWWTDLDAMTTNTRTAEARAAGRTLIEDEKRFIDMGTSSLWLGEIIDVVPPTS